MRELVLRPVVWVLDLVYALISDDEEVPSLWAPFFGLITILGAIGSWQQHDFLNLRVIYGLLLVLFFPGYTLIMAMFPRKNELDEEFDTLYRVTLGMAMSICVVILIGFVLGNPGLGNAPAWEGVSDGEKGYFQTAFVATSLLAATALFFAIGWYRGAYPWLANVHPALARAPPGFRIEAELAVAGKIIPAELLEMEGLQHDRRNVKRKLEEFERRERVGSPMMRSYYEKKRKTLLADLADIDARRAELENALNPAAPGEGLAHEVQPVDPGGEADEAGGADRASED
ncbi:MAG: DUF1616 domain-containing protein [Candidatus Poseidoniia archaeon]|jgi:hypothetical protein|nr:DUF1616 domain-containing protein [Candidatus Poseidoniia archaeon]|tara:strand:+ start:95 stop:955 length:861 start_codon:yes stop_codon:yes gene_type:complete